jgi:hypothetical protein
MTVSECTVKVPVCFIFCYYKQSKSARYICKLLVQPHLMLAAMYFSESYLVRRMWLKKRLTVGTRNNFCERNCCHWFATVSSTPHQNPATYYCYYCRPTFLYETFFHQGYVNINWWWQSNRVFIYVEPVLRNWCETFKIAIRRVVFQNSRFWKCKRQKMCQSVAIIYLWKYWCNWYRHFNVSL